MDSGSDPARAPQDGTARRAPEQQPRTRDRSRAGASAPGHAAGGPRDPRPTATRHARRRPGRHRVAKVTALVTATVLLSAMGAVGAVYLRLQSGIEAADVDSYLGDDRPDPVVTEDAPTDGYAGRALNILVMGTDSRDGENAALAGEVDEMRSDTTMLVHIAADRSRVDVVSVPRDSLVRIPECHLEDGTTTPAQDAQMFNSSFAIGGGPTENLTTAAACTRLTFEENSGVRTDESIVVKMDGVRDVIDALGGVPIDLPEAMDSPKAQLDVPGGPQVFDGTTSLAFLRARTGTGNGLELGSDLARITRQQQFMDALTAQVTDSGLLTDPGRLLPVLTSVTRSLSVSEGLADLRSLAGLALTLKDIGTDHLTTLTVPVADSTRERYRVEWTSAADDLWQRIREDRPLTDAATEPATAPATAPATP
ncbi:MAG TPA: LCP family protein [Cellulomonas sp.]